MTYDPCQPYDRAYLFEPPACCPELLQRMEQDALTLCRALGYDLNTVEFAVADGIPYAIDFMNPVPDADLYSVGEVSFHWIVDAIARLAVRKAQSAPPIEDPRETHTHWSGFLSGTLPKASKPGPARRVVSQKKTRMPEEI